MGREQNPETKLLLALCDQAASSEAGLLLRADDPQRVALAVLRLGGYYPLAKQVRPLVLREPLDGGNLAIVRREETTS